MYAGVAQLVEHYLAKVDVEGSNPFARSNIAAIALVVERILGKDEVTGSNPVSSTKQAYTHS